MKTSVIEVHDMLSVWSVDEVEKRIGEVPGVESVTLNYATGSATVRYDETRLEIPDIKSAVRQRGYESTAPAAPTGDGHEGHTAPMTPSAIAAPAGSNAAPAVPATAGAASAGAASKQDNALPEAPPPTTPKPSPAAADAASAPAPVVPKSAPAPAAAPTGHEQHDKDKS